MTREELHMRLLELVTDPRWADDLNDNHYVDAIIDLIHQHVAEVIEKATPVPKIEHYEGLGRTMSDEDLLIQDTVAFREYKVRLKERAGLIATDPDAHEQKGEKE